MSVILQSCIDCSNSFLSLEDLQRQSYVCDGEGNVYLRIWNPFNLEPFCGDIDDYTITTRTIDGIDYDGIVVPHGLGRSSALFLTVKDEFNNSVKVNYTVIDNNSIFIILDGMTDGSFCIF